jgi:hypothetical protein
MAVLDHSIYFLSTFELLMGDKGQLISSHDLFSEDKMIKLRERHSPHCYHLRWRHHIFYIYQDCSDQSQRGGVGLN